MATRQYIGARYVIKVYENTTTPGSAEWQSGASYEPLTMVTYLNSSYLSKKTVPSSVGNPADNPNYWVVTGYYNGQISSLQNQINALDTALDSVADTVDILDGTTRKVVFVGDSYGVHNTSVPSYVDIFTSYTGYTVNNLCVNGAGFAIAGNTYESQISALSVDNSVTDVFVCGGINDAVAIANGSITASNIRSAVLSFITTALAKFPKAKIYIGFIGSFSDKYAGASLALLNSATACKAYYYYGARFNKRVFALKGIEYVLHDYNLMWTDGFHPGEEGAKQLAYGIYAIWNGKTCNYDGVISSIDYTMLDNSTMRVYELLSSSGVYLSVPTNFQVNAEIANSASADTWYDISTTYNATGSNFTIGDPNTVWLVKCGVYYDDGAGGSTVSSFVPVKFRYNLGKWQVNFYDSILVNKHITRLIGTMFSVNINIDRR